MFRPPKLLAAALGLALVCGGAEAACPNAGWTVVEPKASPDTRPVKQGPRTLNVRREQMTVTADLTGIKLGGDAYDSLILMTFTPEAAKRLHDATTDKSGLRIAFVADDRVLSAVTWTGPYGMDADAGLQMSLGGPAPDVRPVVEAIEACVAKGR